MSGRTRVAAALAAVVVFVGGVAVGQADQHPAPARYTDVVGSRWAWDAIAWAAEEGIMCGVEADLFNPFGRLTRAQLVVILYRYANPDLRPDCPEPPPATTTPAGSAAWEDTSYTFGGEYKPEATLYAVNQPTETGWIEAHCPASGVGRLRFSLLWAYGEIDWAEVARDDTLDVNEYWRWGFLTDDELVGGWNNETGAGGAYSGGQPLSISSSETLTRQLYDRLLTADQLVVQVEPTLEDHPWGWRPETYSHRAVFDLTGDDTALRVAVTDCFPPK